MSEQKIESKRTVKDVIKSELSKFWEDPIVYAIDRWITCFIFMIALSILASALKMLIDIGTYLAS